jgi:hypothetical protein
VRRSIAALLREGLDLHAQPRNPSGSPTLVFAATAASA